MSKRWPQGRCDVTLTERFAQPNCTCDTYPGNLGPCADHEPGGRLGYCVYCDHALTCHPAEFPDDIKRSEIPLNPDPVAS